MSRQFRWFLLAACAFVVVMNGAATIAMLAGGPQLQDSTRESAAPTGATADQRAANRRSPIRKLNHEGELARGDARRP